MEWYPLMFYPIYKEKIWGGSTIREIFQRETPFKNTGESFEISCFDDNISQIRNGKFKDMPFDRLIKDYPDEILGSDVVDKYGKTFPLLLKYIDAKADLSVQVHPDENKVQQMNKGMAKTECWYILQSDNGKLNIGFNRKIQTSEVRSMIDAGKLEQILAYRNVKKDDFFIIHAGTVHAICSGVLLAEIQQASDTTYRLYDYNRRDKHGKLRELHIEDGLRCLNTEMSLDKSIEEVYKPVINHGYTITNLTYNQYFTVNRIEIQQNYKSASLSTSFKVLMFIEGKANFHYNNGRMNIQAGDTLLIPSVLGSYTINGKCNILETYI